MLPYIDIHTHQHIVENELFQVLNTIIGKEEVPNSICSVGIHPWYFDNNLDEQYALLRVAIQQPNVIAIGECGLDKICNTPWDRQIQVFEQQIQLANTSQKPLIIHCVRAYEEVIYVLMEQKVQVPVLFHGVNKKLPLIQSLIKLGYYISFGGFILDGQHDEAIKTIDLTKIFLETDNKSTNIIDIYSYFCRVRNISIEQLKQQLVQNMSNVFNYKIVPQ